MGELLELARATARRVKIVTLPSNVSRPTTAGCIPWREALRDLRPVECTAATDFLLQEGCDPSHATAHGARFCPALRSSVGALGRPALVLPIYGTTRKPTGAVGIYLDGAQPAFAAMGDTGRPGAETPILARTVLDSLPPWRPLADPDQVNSDDGEMPQATMDGSK